MEKMMLNNYRMRETSSGKFYIKKKWQNPMLSKLILVLGVFVRKVFIKEK